MSIDFNCPSCGLRIKVAESAAGRKGKCRQCGQIVNVPAVGMKGDYDKSVIEVRPAARKGGISTTPALARTSSSKSVPSTATQARNPTPLDSVPPASSFPNSRRNGIFLSAAIVVLLATGALFFSLKGQGDGTGRTVNGSKESTVPVAKSDGPHDVAVAPSPKMIDPPVSSAWPSIKDDPAASFEGFSTEFVKTGKKLGGDDYKSQGDVRIEWTKDQAVTINVERTDSLISPYVGTITSSVTSSSVVPDKLKELLASQMVDGRLLDGHNFTLTFAAQKGQWILKSIKSYSDYHTENSAVIQPFMEQVFQSVKQP